MLSIIPIQAIEAILAFYHYDCQRGRASTAALRLTCNQIREEGCPRCTQPRPLLMPKDLSGNHAPASAGALRSNPLGRPYSSPINRVSSPRRRPSEQPKPNFASLAWAPFQPLYDFAAWMSGTPLEDAQPTISSTPTVVALPSLPLSPPPSLGGQLGMPFSLASWSGESVPFTLGDHEHDVVFATHDATGGGSSNPQEVPEVMHSATGGGSSTLLSPDMTTAAAFQYRHGLLLLALSKFELAASNFNYAARWGHEGAREELAKLHGQGYF